MPSSPGKDVRMQRVLGADGRGVIGPFDDRALSGPEGGLYDVGATIGEAVAGGVDSILAFRGLFKNYSHLIPGNVGRIINVTGSTTRGQHTRKGLTADTAAEAVRDALS